MKLKAFLIMAGLWMGLLALTACGGADVRTYQYPEPPALPAAPPINFFVFCKTAF